MDTKQRTSHRLTVECKRLLRILAQKMGVSQTDIIEMAVREKAQKEGIDAANADIFVSHPAN